MTQHPMFHFVPATGWMNDPNGLIERDGVHHLFFQHDPHSTAFGVIHWGHATSTDLLTWTEQPIALAPGDAGDYDRDGCWSGVAVALDDGSVAVVYSGNLEGRQLPCVAVAQDPDLVTWEKSVRNPVVAAWPPGRELTDFRDHAVSRAGDRWRQVVAAGADGGAGGSLISYLSDGDDLTAWTLEGVLLDGASAGLPGEVWECPDLFEDDGEVVGVLSWYVKDTERDALLGSDVIWLVGTLDGGRFEPRRYGRLDLGDRFYAPQSYTTADGRRLMFGWLRTQDDPGSTGRPSVGAQSLPRWLRLDAGALRQEPAAELASLHRTVVATVTGAGGVDLPSPADALELVVTGDGAGAREVVSATRLVLVGAEGRRSVVDLTGFAADSTWERVEGRWVAVSLPLTSVTVLVDSGLVEAFGDDGRAAATSDLALEPVVRIEVEPGADPVVTPVTVEVRTLAPAPPPA